MGKVDCVMEACQENYDDGYSQGYSQGVSEAMDEIIRKVLVNSDLSAEDIARCAEVPLERVLKIERSLQ